MVHDKIFWGNMLLSWIIFAIIIVSLLVIDLGFFSKEGHVMDFKESIFLSIFYISIGCLFGLYVLYEMGSEAAHEYYAGFLLEKAMSLDNIFLISIIFKFFAIPTKYQHRVLFWGILGVIILRAIMILIGTALIAKFSWILFIFGAILIATGIKTWIMDHEKPINLQEMWIYKYLSRHFEIYPKIDNEKFFVKVNSKTAITPLFMALVMIEFVDLIFAIDSIPAIFAITQNPFVIYTSNIFAILGLRALFFLLAQINEKFKLVKYSLALILVLIGSKIFIKEFIEIPKFAVLIVIAVVLVAGMILSIVQEKRQRINNLK